MTTNASLGQIRAAIAEQLNDDDRVTVAIPVRLAEAIDRARVIVEEWVSEPTTNDDEEA